MLIARIFTLYPEFFPGPLGKGLYGKALAEKIWKLETVNIRDYATDKHKTVDDTTYGGGSGMLIKPDVLANSLDKNLSSKEKIKMFLARIFTLYPDYFPGPLSKGLYGKAMEKKIWDIETVNIRDYATDKHKTVDDTPYGGGLGMLIKPDVLAKALDEKLKVNEKIYYLSPKGKLFNQKLAKELSKEGTINLICGHFEGVDQRVIDSRNIVELSIGDFILSGGESAAFVVMDAILRLIPGVIGNDNSINEETFVNGLLEYPQYTKPKIWEKKSVPDVLLSGDHDKIKDWRLSQSEVITRDRRPDLWQKYKKN